MVASRAERKSERPMAVTASHLRSYSIFIPPLHWLRKGLLYRQTIQSIWIDRVYNKIQEMSSQHEPTSIPPRSASSHYRTDANPHHHCGSEPPFGKPGLLRL